MGKDRDSLQFLLSYYDSMVCSEELCGCSWDSDTDSVQGQNFRK